LDAHLLATGKRLQGRGGDPFNKIRGVFSWGQGNTST